MSTKPNLYIWPDGAWCWYNEFESFGSARSDDYMGLHLPEWADEEDAEAIANKVLRGEKIDLGEYFGT